MKGEINFRFIGILVVLLVALIVLYIYVENKPEDTVILDTTVLVEDTAVLEIPTNTITVVKDDEDWDVVLEDEEEEELSPLNWDTVIIEDVYSGAVVYRPEVEHNYCE